MWILPVPWGQIPTSSLRKHGIKPALRLCTQSACRFSAILPRNPLPDMQSACGISEQSAKKSDDASYAQALFGVPLEPVLHLYKHRCKTGSFYFVRYCLWKMRGRCPHRPDKSWIVPAAEALSVKLPVPQKLFSDSCIAKISYILIQKDKFRILKLWKRKTSKKRLTVPRSCAIIIIVAAHECWCSSVGRAADL